MSAMTIEKFQEKWDFKDKKLTELIPDETVDSYTITNLFNMNFSNSPYEYLLGKFFTILFTLNILIWNEQSEEFEPEDQKQLGIHLIFNTRNEIHKQFFSKLTGRDLETLYKHKEHVIIFELQPNTSPKCFLGNSSKGCVEIKCAHKTCLEKNAAMVKTREFKRNLIYLYSILEVLEPIQPPKWTLELVPLPFPLTANSQPIIVLNKEGTTFHVKVSKSKFDASGFFPLIPFRGYFRHLNGDRDITLSSDSDAVLRITNSSIFLQKRPFSTLERGDYYFKIPNSLKINQLTFSDTVMRCPNPFVFARVTQYNFKNTNYISRFHAEMILKMFASLHGLVEINLLSNKETKHFEIVKLPNAPNSTQKIFRPNDLVDCYNKESQNFTGTPEEVKSMVESHKSWFFLGVEHKNLPNLHVLAKILSMYPSYQDLYSNGIAIDLMGSNFRLGPHDTFDDTYFSIPTAPRIPIGAANTRSFPIFLKPNGLTFQGLRAFIQAFTDPDFSILKEFDMVEGIFFHYTEDMIREFYPGCFSRPWGKEWIRYLTSTPSYALRFEIPDNEHVQDYAAIIRKKCIQAREASGFIWTKNIVHCPADLEEATQNMVTFKKLVNEEFKNVLHENILMFV